MSIGKAAGQLCFYLIIKLPVCWYDFPAIGLRDIKQVLDGQPGIVILADRQSCRAFIDVSAKFVPYWCGGKHGDVCAYTSRALSKLYLYNLAAKPR